MPARSSARRPASRARAGARSSASASPTWRGSSAWTCPWRCDGPVLTAELALGLGRASARLARERGAGVAIRVLIGRDTRRSGFMCSRTRSRRASRRRVASPCARACCRHPGWATLVRLGAADLGVVVSASHNPFPDNGIKLFGDDGYKLADAEEDRVVELIGEGDLPTGDALGEVAWLPDAGARDVDGWSIASVPVSELGRVLVDCANGAASAVAARLFERLGVEADLINALPDGLNINERVGLDDTSTCPRLWRWPRATTSSASPSTWAHADRVLAVTGSGEPRRRRPDRRDPGPRPRAPRPACPATSWS